MVLYLSVTKKRKKQKTFILQFGSPDKMIASSFASSLICVLRLQVWLLSFVFLLVSQSPAQLLCWQQPLEHSKFLWFYWVLSHIRWYSGFGYSWLCTRVIPRIARGSIMGCQRSNCGCNMQSQCPFFCAIFYFLVPFWRSMFRGMVFNEVAFKYLVS